MKENKPGQSIYDQLQEILNECIRLGWKPLGINYSKAHLFESKMFLLFDEVPEERLSYHDLFSKDSGLMEFVEWKDNREGAFYHPKLLLHHYNVMSIMEGKKKIEYFINNAIVPTLKEEVCKSYVKGGQLYDCICGECF